MLTIDPGAPRAVMSAMAPAIRKKGARAFTAKSMSQRSVVASSKAPRVVRPAALTRPSIRLKRSRAALIAVPGAPGSPRSAITSSVWQGRSSPTGSRSTRTSASAPASAACRAMAAPMPRAAPVTRTTMPASPTLIPRPPLAPEAPEPPASASYPHLDAAVLHPGGVGRQRHADRTPECRARLVVETPVVLGTFDRVVHHQTVGQMHLLVCAEPVGAPDPAVEVAVDGEGPLAVVETDHVLLLDPVQRADIDPVGHPVSPLSLLQFLQCPATSSAWNSAR